ncbi:MAG: hypothetical protein WKF85_15615 [Chitinophagaceae bacterium]
MTLLQAIQKFSEKIQVTDRQEKTIDSSITYLRDNLLNPEKDGLHVTDVFVNGSYERDTIIRPLDDVDVFAVLDPEKHFENGMLPDPKSILQKMKKYLSEILDYEGKLTRDVPCITLELSKINFDILPSFQASDDLYYIPTYDLSGWTISEPKVLSAQLNEINKTRKYLVKPTIHCIKKWNVINDKYVPSFHIEEIAISLFQWREVKNLYDGILHWFENSESRFDIGKFKSQDALDKAVTRHNTALKTLSKAKEEYEDGNEDDAIVLWKQVFGIDFPTLDEEEAKNFNKALSEGTLKVAASGAISMNIGITAAASKGFYGNENSQTNRK